MNPFSDQVKEFFILCQVIFTCKRYFYSLPSLVLVKDVIYLQRLISKSQSVMLSFKHTKVTANTTVAGRMAQKFSSATFRTEGEARISCRNISAITSFIAGFSRNPDRFYAK